MTIGNALKFIKRGVKDPDLRNRLNHATTVSECKSILAEEKLIFSEHDFDEAFHHQLTLCQESQTAEKINEFKMWWTILHHLLTPEPCDKPCDNCF